MDAPISGMEARAIEGTLTVMCGGERAVFERVKPYLDCIGNKILYMGPTGSGQLTKLINQLLFDINAAALGEILPMAAKMGLDPDLVGEVVNSGTGRSYASEFFIPRILKGHFGDGYPMSPRLQGPGQRGRARGQSGHPHAGARGRHGDLPGGPAARARREGQRRHGLRPRGPARRCSIVAAPTSPDRRSRSAGESTEFQSLFEPNRTSIWRGAWPTLSKKARQPDWVDCSQRTIHAIIPQRMTGP